MNSIDRNTDLATYLEKVVENINAWVAEDPENRWACTPVTDVAFWAEMGIHTVDDYILDSLRQQYIDVHEYAYDFKPDWRVVSKMTEQELEDALARIKQM